MSRRIAGSSRKAAPRGFGLGRLLQPLVRFPLRTAAVLVAGALCVLIVVNAVGLQTARHPSPWFGAPPEKVERPVVQADAGRTMSAPATPQSTSTPRLDINSLLEPRRVGGAVPLPRPKLPPG